MKRKMGKNEIITPEVETVHNRSESDDMTGNERPFLLSQHTHSADINDKKQVSLKVPVRPFIRPKRYTSPRKMQDVINKYFDACDTHEEPYTIEGLSLALGFSTETLRAYEKEDSYSKFNTLVQSAKLKIQHQRVVNMQKGKLNPLTAIFLLVNGHRTDYKQKPDLVTDEEKVSSFLITRKPTNKEDNAG